MSSNEPLANEPEGQGPVTGRDERPSWQRQLEAGLERVQDALAKNERPHAQLLQVVVAAASAKVVVSPGFDVGFASGRDRNPQNSRYANTLFKRAHMSTSASGYL